MSYLAPFDEPTYVFAPGAALKPSGLKPDSFPKNMTTQQLQESATIVNAYNTPQWSDLDEHFFKPENISERLVCLDFDPF